MGDSQPQAPEPPDRSAYIRRRRSPTDESHGQDAGGSTRATVSSLGVVAATPSLMRRISSDESQTGWFDRSNRNPNANFEATVMDVDLPFFQKSSASPDDFNPAAPGVSPQNVSNSSAARPPQLRAAATQSSSADDFRSVIDDLTVENKRLKEELKRYKQFGTDLMRKDKLFEIKVHGLPSRKKRELEATLRHFAASLEGSTEASSRQKNSRSSTRGISQGGSLSKHASSSSSRSRPVDSAYASMSIGTKTGHHSHAAQQFGHPSLATRARTSNQKVESYLQDIPEGLYPRFLTMTEKEKRKLVVKRLEHLFTGEIKAAAVSGGPTSRPVNSEEPGREAHMQVWDKKSSRANQSQSNDSGDGTSGGGGGSAGGSGNGSGGSHHQSVSTASEQRPTRPRDLDPNRVQVPAENVEYIRHLGIVAPDLRPGTKTNPHNVSLDADGWVYLNLLCNLAQLHMYNVTPDFIRSAVSSKSTKFQLSPDGRKIRWRGGSDGTLFSSDSGTNSSRERSNSEGDEGFGDGEGSGFVKQLQIEQGTKRKLGAGAEERTQTSSKNTSKLGPQATRSSSTSVQYKPMFIRTSSSFDTSMEQTSSRASVAEDSNLGNTSKWDYSGSGSSPHKRRRLDGAIVYYTGAPFCTDLSGDPGDISPAAYMASATKTQQQEKESISPRHALHRTMSGSFLAYRPFSDMVAYARLQEELEQVMEDTHIGSDASDSEDSDIFPWSEDVGERAVKPTEHVVLEACGLGSVIPDDHFRVAVVTRRPRKGVHHQAQPRLMRARTESTASAILRRRRLVLSNPRETNSAPAHSTTKEHQPVSVEYVSARMRRLDPVPLPPAAMFFPPFSSSSSDSEEFSDSDDLLDDSDKQGAASRSFFPTEALPSLFIPASLDGASAPDAEGLQTTDEEDDDDVDESGDVSDEIVAEDDAVAGSGAMSWQPGKAGGGPSNERSLPLHSTSRHRSRRSVLMKVPEQLRTESSAATAGGRESGFSSSAEG